MFLRRQSIVISLITGLLATALPVPTSAQTSRPGAWTSDLHDLDRSIRETHPDPFRNVPEEDFEAQVARLEQEIPGLEDYEIVVEFMRLVASLQDGHSGVFPGNQPGFDRQYPVMIYPFEEGVFLVGAAARYEEHVGGRVTRIGNCTTEEAIERLKPVINGENEFTVLDRIPRFLTYPLVLHALGISDSGEQVELTVETAAGEQTAFTVTPVPESDFSFVGPEVTSPGAVSARSGPAPPHLAQLQRPFWFELRPDDDLVYVQFNRVRDAEDETFARFCDRLFGFMDENGVETLVLDIRYNHGGNNQLVQPLIHGAIRRNHGFNRPGHFYAVTGRGTFSAAISTTAWLEENTDVRFAGEPTGSGPTHFGDADRIVLPETGLQVWISAWEWQTRLPWDRRAWFAPQVPAPPTFAAYREGRDEAMEAILVDRNEPSLEEVVRAALEEGADQVAPAYRAYKSRHPDYWSTTETEINILGYTLLGEEKYAAAIAVFRLNTESYPESVNGWDSLAEAYMNSGDREKAIALYRKALELDPEFANARQMLDRLEGLPSRQAESGH